MKQKLLLHALLFCFISTLAVAQGTWSQKADFGGMKRIWASGFGIGDKAYLGTGSSNSQSVYYKDFWELDPATNTWTQKADMPGVARDRAVGFALGNKGYIGTGSDKGSAYLKDLWEYDPLSNTWSRKADLAGPGRYSAFVFTIGNKAYVGTGDIAAYTHSKDFYEYDQATDTWTKRADFPGLARQYAVGFSVDDKGYAGTGYAEMRFKDIWQYNPVTDAWLRKADFPGGVRSEAVAFTINGKGYLGTGQYDSYHPVKDFWEYDAVTDNWTRKPDVGNTLRQFATGFVSAGKGYIGTGNNGTTDLADFWEYTPAGTGYPPSITSFFPAAGPVSSAVTINGNNFSTDPLEDIVYFGAVRAVVASAANNQLKVYVPVGTTYQPITVTVHNLVAYSERPFLVTFPGGDDAFSSHSFDLRKDIPLGYNPCGTYIADLDGDGRTDIITGDFNTTTISILRNTSVSHVVSFAKQKKFTAGNGNRHCTAGDLDGDGKPDVVTCNIYANTISVLRNISTKGDIQFAVKIDLSTPQNPGYAVINDLDGDGKPDIIATNFGASAFSVFRNTSTPGNISFEAHKDFATAAGNFNCVVTDIDGDGKPDVIAGTEAASNIFSIFRNTSSVGTISFDTRIDYTTYFERQGIAVGDFDGDRKPDIAVENFNNPEHALSVFKNLSTKGVIKLAPKKDYASGGDADFAVISDLNGDGKADIVLNNYWSSNISVFKNTGGNGVIAFAPKVDYTTGSGPRFLNAGDIDGDGKPDIVLDNLFSESVSVLRNVIGNNGCNQPYNLAVSDITNSTARLTWTLPDSTNNTVEIRYHAVGDSAWMHTRTNGSQNGVTLHGLLPGTTFQWQVRSNCNGEITGSVNGPSFTTNPAAVYAEANDAIQSNSKVSVDISPNPVTNNSMKLHFKNVAAGAYRLSITDMFGNMLITKHILSTGVNINETLDVSKLQAGIFILKLIGSNSVVTEVKFIKMN